ncbi:MAG: methionine--tRNA ligase [Candidatus Sumerlaeia bacterium]|nr:methionine--tRNA ligase [Candidatus Sumerlaeia bacterium]
MAKFFITTAIHYVNGPPHIGHVYETIGADVLARHHRLRGDEVLFLTGTDEHGIKVQRKAAAEGVTPRALADRNSLKFQQAFDRLLISNDDFIRTTDRRHVRAVQRFWQAVETHGDIYDAKYEGWYCIQDENFVTEKEAKEIQEHPELGKTVEWQSEDAKFFRLSAFQGHVERLIEGQADFIRPENRRNEMVSSYLRPGLRDVCVSRTTLDWGIPVPNAPGHVVYVWFDALINYISAIGYGGDEEVFRRWWPADVHVIGKDIVKFHTALWPAMLHAAGLEPPRRVFGHGFLTVGGKKMGKTLGNVVDPLEIAARYGPEALRYGLLRENDFGGDGNYDADAIHTRYHSDLANGLGNLVNRTLSMLERYLYGCHHAQPELPEAETALLARFGALFARLDEMMDAFRFSQVLAEIWELIAALNKYIDDTKPWELAKAQKPDPRPRLHQIFATLAEGLRWTTAMVAPFLPDAAGKIWSVFHPGRPLEKWTFRQIAARGAIPDQTVLAKPPVLFPRVEKPSA